MSPLTLEKWMEMLGKFWWQLVRQDKEAVSQLNYASCEKRLNSYYKNQKKKIIIIKYIIHAVVMSF